MFRLAKHTLLVALVLALALPYFVPAKVAADPPPPHDYTKDHFTWIDAFTIQDNDTSESFTADPSMVFNPNGSLEAHTWAGSNFDRSWYGALFERQGGQTCFKDHVNNVAIQGTGYFGDVGHVPGRAVTNYDDYFRIQYVSYVGGNSQFPEDVCHFALKPSAISIDKADYSTQYQNDKGRGTGGKQIAPAGWVDATDITLYSYFIDKNDPTGMRTTPQLFSECSDCSMSKQNLTGFVNVAYQQDTADFPQNANGWTFFTNPSEKPQTCNNNSFNTTLPSTLFVSPGFVDSFLITGDQVCYVGDFSKVSDATFSGFPAYQYYYMPLVHLENQKIPGGGGQPPPGGGQTQQVCDAGAGGFTWLVCGLINLISDTSNAIKDHVIIPYLQVQPLTAHDSSGNDTDTYASWKNIRSIADALLIVIFFIIIFAQALSLNIDAYTIKKMLPRLIAATILIQFSFYIAAIAVDITNVLGNGVADLLTKGILPKVNGVTIPSGTGAEGFLRGITIAGAAILGAASLFTGAIFAVLIPFILGIIATALVLMFRQLLIIVLVIVAPVAFVLWILPNTSKYFKMWWDFLIKALLMYPLITLLFAGGTIAATILVNNASIGSNQSAGAFVKDLAAIAAVTIPLILVPFTFKFAGSALTAVAGAATKFRGTLMGGPQKDKLFGKLQGNLKQGASGQRRNMATGMGYRIPFTDKYVGGDSASGRRGIASYLANPHKLGKYSTRASMKGMGEQVEAAAKEFKAYGMDTNPIFARMVVGGKRGYDAMVAEETAKGAAADQVKLQNYKRIWDVASKFQNSAPHIEAAAGTLAATEQINRGTRADIHNRFQNTAQGERVWANTRVAALKRNPHYLSIDYRTGQIGVGSAAKAVAGAGIDKVSEFSPDALAHALRDKYDKGDTTIDDATIKGWLSDPKLSQNSRNLIRAIQTGRRGMSVEDFLSDKARRDSLGMKEDLAGYSP